MRKSRLFVIALLFIAPSVFAQKERSFSVFISEFRMSSSSSTGRHWYSDYGAAFENSFTPRLSVQLSVASEHHQSYPYVVDNTGYINQVPAVSFRTYPIDVTARYRFVNASRWKPFLGLGARYVAAPHVDSMFGYRNRFSPEAVGGVVFQLRHFGVAFEGKALVGDRENYDTALRTSVGLNWRF
jgi:outer membrane protein W